MACCVERRLRHQQVAVLIAHLPHVMQESSHAGRADEADEQERQVLRSRTTNKRSTFGYRVPVPSWCQEQRAHGMRAQSISSRCLLNALHCSQAYGAKHALLQRDLQRRLLRLKLRLGLG